MRGELACAATLLAAGPGAWAAATAADFEACVARSPGESAQARAERADCFAALLAGAPARVPGDGAPPTGLAPAAASSALPNMRPVQVGPGNSQFTRLWGSKAERSELRAGEYQLNYFLPAFYARHAGLAPEPVGATAQAGADRRATEGKFQLSLKGHVFPRDDTGAHDLWLAYTQVSHWQMWNTEGSRPFRETNYEPELLYTYEPAARSFAGWQVGHAGLSLNHQSNGRGGGDSRSWNRVIAFVRAEKGDTLVTLRGWARFREGGIDDNPGIQNYAGRADLQVSHQFSRGGVLVLTGRHSLRGGAHSRGAIQADYSLPLCRESGSRWCFDSLRAHLQYFRGYAESLIDYDRLDTYYGLGFSIGAWK